MTTTSFEIPFIQILNEDAKLVGELPAFADEKTLVHLYRTMVQLRAYDAKAINLQRTGKMGTYAATLGQEAISTCVGFAMKETDVLVPYYRDYGSQIQRKTAFTDIYRYWGGDERGSAFEVPGSEDFPICVPIASQCLHAAGVASAFKYRNEKRVCVTSIGDGGTSEGDFYEAINVAGTWALPFICVIHNNQWAISVPLYKQTRAKTLAQKAIAAGIDGIQVDGNDFIAMTEVMLKALDKARAGKGPTLIEALSYRLHDHTTADDATRYRSQAEVDTAWTKEPILRAKKYLMSCGFWDEDKEKALLEECAKNVDNAVECYVNDPPQKPESMFDSLYETLPEAYASQRQEVVESE